MGIMSKKETSNSYGAYSKYSVNGDLEFW